MIEGCLLGSALAVAVACSGGDGGGRGGAPGATGGGSGGTATGGEGVGGLGGAGTGGVATGGTTGTGGVSGLGGRGGKGGAGSGGSGAVAGSGGSAGVPGSGGSAGISGIHNPFTSGMINAYVDAHNNARAGRIVTLSPAPSPALPPVTWDPILADSAYAYTMKCVGDGSLLSHNANRTTDYRALGGKDSYVGENIYGTTGGTPDPLDVVTAWVNEITQYTYGPITSASVSNAGHYTQVVWRGSVRIGCAFFNCPSQKFHSSVLCDYAPGGNIIGDKPY